MKLRTQLVFPQLDLSKAMVRSQNVKMAAQWEKGFAAALRPRNRYHAEVCQKAEGDPCWIKLPLANLEIKRSGIEAEQLSASLDCQLVG